MARRVANQSHLLEYGLDGSRYVFIECGMPRLKHGGVVLFSADEKVHGVDLADIEDVVYGNFDKFRDPPYGLIEGEREVHPA